MEKSPYRIRKMALNTRRTKLAQQGSRPIFNTRTVAELPK
jgi:hypothetical protein